MSRGKNLNEKLILKDKNSRGVHLNEKISKKVQRKKLNAKKF